MTLDLKFKILLLIFKIRPINIKNQHIQLYSFPIYQNENLVMSSSLKVLVNHKDWNKLQKNPNLWRRNDQSQAVGKVLLSSFNGQRNRSKTMWIKRLFQLTRNQLPNKNLVPIKKLMNNWGIKLKFSDYFIRKTRINASYSWWTKRNIYTHTNAEWQYHRLLPSQNHNCWCTNYYT